MSSTHWTTREVPSYFLNEWKWKENLTANFKEIPNYNFLLCPTSPVVSKYRYCTYVRICTICVIPLGYFTKITPTKFAEYQKLDYKSLISCTDKLPNKWKPNKNSYQYPLESNHTCARSRARARTHTHTHTHKSETTRAFFCPLISKTAREVQWIMQRTANIKLPLYLRYCTSIFKTCISTPQTPSSTEACGYPADFQYHHLLFIALNGGSSSDVTDPTQWNHWLNKHFHTGENLARKTFCCVK